MSVPKLLKTTVNDENFGGVTYHIEGELVPVLQVELQTVKIYFEHHVLLWKDTNVEITTHAMSGGFKRVMAGLPIFLTEAQGPGRIAFSRDGAGHIIPLHLESGQSVEVREHQFLATTENVDYTFKRVKGMANMFLGGTGFFIDTFACKGNKPGVLWLHGYGNIFEIDLKGGETIDVEPGGWIYKDPGVSMETKLQRLSTGLFASAGQLCWNRFTGPGRLALQSMYLHMPTEE